MQENIVIFLNCDMLELEIRDIYKKLYCDYVSFRIVTMFLSVSYDYVFEYCSSCNTVAPQSTCIMYAFPIR